MADLAWEKRRYETAAKQYAAVALLIEDAQLTPLALWRAEQAYRKAGQEKEADQAMLRRGKQYPQFRPPAERP
ncbi:MAG: hypothetical protein HC901_04290 [Bdellovibrionaceae bacterium]|nr:hypothetical protein [Pseudobdellovibrionaceae bacterium]